LFRQVHRIPPAAELRSPNAGLADSENPFTEQAALVENLLTEQAALVKEPVKPAILRAARNANRSTASRACRSSFAGGIMHLAGNPGFAEETTGVIEQSSISAALMTRWRMRASERRSTLRYRPYPDRPVAVIIAHP
jgi:hypothetical protein